MQGPHLTVLRERLEATGRVPGLGHEIREALEKIRVHRGRVPFLEMVFLESFEEETRAERDLAGGRVLGRPEAGGNHLRGRKTLVPPGVGSKTTLQSAG